LELRRNNRDQEAAENGDGQMHMLQSLWTLNALEQVKTARLYIVTCRVPASAALCCIALRLMREMNSGNISNGGKGRSSAESNGRCCKKCKTQDYKTIFRDTHFLGIC
jgi:hypothetical protein